ncbi:MAG: hypothetical protein ABL861_02090 [Nitrosomonas sp.]
MTKPHLTFYDTSRAYYAGYYLHGFKELESDDKLQVNVTHILPMRLKPAIQNTSWQHLLFTMALFKLQQGDNEWYFCIDTHDENSANAESYSGGYHLPLLQCVDVYFKVNYNPDEIARNPALKVFHEKIRNISQFFPLRLKSFLTLSRKLILPSVWFGFKPGLGYNQPYDSHLADAKWRLRDHKKFQPLERILAHRTVHKDIDIFFVTSFRKVPPNEAVMEHRYKIIKKLACIPKLNKVVGFTNHESLPEKYAAVFHPYLSQAEYLEKLARTKVVIYTQGICGCISSKFGLAMALGVAVIGEPLMNNPELLVTYPHLKEQFSFTNPDEIVDYAIHLATHPEKARELGALNAVMFDNQLAPRPTAEYVLRTLSVIP